MFLFDADCFDFLLAKTFRAQVLLALRRETMFFYVQ